MGEVIMKRLLSIILVLCLVFVCVICPAGAEGPFVEEGTEQVDSEREPLPEVLKVGSSTMVNGCFFTNLWGNNTSDIDVRSMLHGLSTTAWISEVEYGVNKTVVKEALSEDNDDGSVTYYIKLNENLKFSDGTDITAADYVFSVLYQASPLLTQLGAAEIAYTYIKGYEDYHSGKTPVFAGVRLLGTYIFALTVEAEYLPYFYEDAYIDVTPYPINALLGEFEVIDSINGAFIAGMSVTHIENGEEVTITKELTVELVKDKLFGENGYMSAPAVVSGPYKLVRYDAETGYVEFEKNPYYIGNYEGVVPEIEKVTLEYSATSDAADDLMNGRFHIINKVVTADVMNELIETGAKISTYARRGLGYVIFACDSEILSDENVRKAISCAIDRETYVSELLGEYGVNVYGYYGIGQWMARAANGAFSLEDLTAEEQTAWDEVVLEELNTTPYDLVVAGKLLDKAGWNKSADGSDYTSGIRYKDINGELKSLTLRYAKSIESKAAKLLEGYMAEASAHLGIELIVEDISFTDMLSELYSPGERPSDIYFMGSNFDEVFNPVSTFAVDEKYEGIANISHIKDERLELLAKVMNRIESGDVLGYYLAWYAFQQRFTEVMPMLPIYSDVYADFSCDMLIDYEIMPHEGWPQAIIYANFNQRRNSK